MGQAPESGIQPIQTHWATRGSDFGASFQPHKLLRRSTSPPTHLFTELFSSTAGRRSMMGRNGSKHH